MGENESNIINSVIDKTSSELILYTIVIVVALAVVAIPFYVLSNKKANKRENNLMEICRESNKAIREHTKETAKLNGTLIRIHARIDDLFNNMSDQNKRNDDVEKALENLKNSFMRIHDRIDVISKKIK